MFDLLLENAQRPFFHFLCLPRGFVEARLKVRPSVFPRHLDGGFHVVSQDNKLVGGRQGCESLGSDSF